MMTNMDLMALLSTVVLIATILTTLFAIGTYMVSRGYTRRRQKPAGGPAHASILRRYNPFEA